MNPDPTSLDRMHDLVVPPPVPWWPPAPGWYWVLGFLAVALVVLLLWGILRWQHRRYRREALAELARQEPTLEQTEQRARGVAALAELLKRTALSAWPRETVASLTGPAWLEFLDRTGRTTEFSKGAGVLLERVAYDPRTALEPGQVRDLAALVRRWVKEHR